MKKRLIEIFLYSILFLGPINGAFASNITVNLVGGTAFLARTCDNNDHCSGYRGVGSSYTVENVDTPDKNNLVYFDIWARHDVYAFSLIDKTKNGDVAAWGISADPQFSCNNVKLVWN